MTKDTKICPACRIIKSINEMGAQGWELVSARRIIEDKSGQDRYEGIFKLKK